MNLKTALSSLFLQLARHTHRPAFLDGTNRLNRGTKASTRRRMESELLERVEKWAKENPSRVRTWPVYCNRMMWHACVYA